MEGVHCCETCPDEEQNLMSNSKVNKMADEDSVPKQKDISVLTLDSNNQLIQDAAKTELLVSNRTESLVGIRKMMFENLNYSSKPEELTDDDKVVIKAKKGSLFNDKNITSSSSSAVADNKQDNKRLLNYSDNVFSVSNINGNNEVGLDINKASVNNSSDSGTVNSEDVKTELRDVSDNIASEVIDLPYIDNECESSSEDISKSGNTLLKQVNVTDLVEVKEDDTEELEYEDVFSINEASNEKIGVVSDNNEDVKSIDKDVSGSIEDLSDTNENEMYLEMRSIPAVVVQEPIYEEIGSLSNVSVSIQEDDKIDTVNVLNDVDNNVDKSLDDSKKSVEENVEELKSVTPDMCGSKEIEENKKGEFEVSRDTIIVDEVQGSNKSEVDEDYPSELNPFGDDEEQEEEKDVDEQNQTMSTNPFESDMEDDEEVDVKTISKPVPAARRKSSNVETSGNDYASHLNPFGSGSEEDEETFLISPPVPLPRKLKSPQLSPMPVPRSSRHRHTASISSLNSSIYNESPSPRRKKSAPAPPSQSATLRSRKARPPPPPPPVPLTSPPTSISSVIPPSSPPPLPLSAPPTETSSIVTLPSSPSSSNEVSALITTYLQEMILKDGSKEVDDDGTLKRDKSTFGQWKRRKGQAPAPPVPQRRAVKPMPLKEVRQELADIEVKQQELERQGVSLEQTIRDRFDQEASVTPFVEELVLQLFELVNEKNELFRRQAELMCLRRQHNLEEEHADLEYQIRCLMLCPEHNKTDSDKEREEELIKRLVDVVERRNAVVQGLDMDRLRESEEDKSVNTQLAIGSQIDLTNIDKIDKKGKIDKKKLKGIATLDREPSEGVASEKSPKHKKFKKKWFTLQHTKKQ